MPREIRKVTSAATHCYYFNACRLPVFLSCFPGPSHPSCTAPSHMYIRPFSTGARVPVPPNRLTLSCLANVASFPHILHPLPVPTRRCCSLLMCHTRYWPPPCTLSRNQAPSLPLAVIVYVPPSRNEYHRATEQPRQARGAMLLIDTPNAPSPTYNEP